ncbi:DUF72 domain-containing protein [Aurantimonas sp. VKM B-3413]|uniref:DUF72 domain-containing protein n=1 Tax=Aurantimonas sp. VKM B-3413 TaxID=2779401 RepID=UPI001E462FA9|nr:DUF72 domain-containing protein [Aurantimonas sp. VKM B-3413]MCB8836192.1 DUF72 domain-containing protein [Aurantimonas sp. VKM B-3413]
MVSKSGTIRSGIGGWTFKRWDETFYPADLPKKRQLEYAASKLTTIEVNGTFYRSQKPETFASWAQQAPEGFVFSLKAPRYAVNRKVLAEGGESIGRFVQSGIVELGDKLGPLLWQLAATKRFDPDDFAAFLKLLPAKVGSTPLRHVVELRHESFACPEAVALCRKAGVAIVHAESADYPEMSDVTTDFVYLRLQKGDETIPTAYPPDALDRWAERAKVWAKGGQPDDLPRADPDHAAPTRPRDVFVYFIRSGKPRAPHAAMALMERLAES